MVKRPSNIAQFYLALNPAGFVDKGRYEARASHVAEVITKAKPTAGSAGARLPGARGHAANRTAKADGLAVTDNLANALKNTARIIESRNT
jgi:LDH2 family malate/lactate/ureidoglycolate dehydrogenase